MIIIHQLGIDHVTDKTQKIPFMNMQYKLYNYALVPKCKIISTMIEKYRNENNSGYICLISGVIESSTGNLLVTRRPLNLMKEKNNIIYALHLKEQNYAHEIIVSRYIFNYIEGEEFNISEIYDKHQAYYENEIKPKLNTNKETRYIYRNKTSCVSVVSLCKYRTLDTEDIVISDRVPMQTLEISARYIEITFASF